jgi:peptide/nickel transport system substrate-binding protein
VVVLAGLVGVQGVAGAATRGAVKFDPNAVFRIGTQQSVQSLVLDPRISATGQEAVWDTALYAPLMRFDAKTNKYSPYLAQAVTVVDPQTIKVQLRSDAKFDSGAPVTATDAKATIEATAKNAKAGKCNGCIASAGTLTSVEVVDAQTFVLHYSGPSLGFVYDLLVGRETMIVPASAGAEQNTKPVGDGPFKFVSLVPNSQIVLTKSSSFFDANNIRLGGLKFQILVNGTPQANALFAGDIDAAYGLDASTYTTAQGKGFQVLNALDGNGIFYVDMCESPNYFFQNPMVRQALQYGTNRPAMTQQIERGLSIPMYTIFAPGQAQYNATIAKKYAFSTKKAKALLSQAGVQQGATVRMLVNTSTYAEFNSGSLILKDQWSKLGLNVTLTPTNDIVGDYIDPARGSAKNPKADGAMNQFSRPNLQKLTRWFVPGGAANSCGYNNAQVNSIATELAGLSPTDPKAIADWKQAAQLVADDASIIPLFQTPVLRGLAKNVKGAKVSTFATENLVGNRWTDLYMTASK